ncbi:Glycosyltransferase like family 2 [Candidatus Nanopelagicaceae bacterium]
MSTQRVTALLVVHDGATWLPEVVASIASQKHSADQILALDTGSLDSSPKLLKGARIPVTTLDREIGFGAAIAYGVSQLPPAIDGAQEWLWILHDDCVFDPHALEALLAAVVDRPNVVMVGPKLLGWYDRTHLLEVGISIATNGARWSGLEPHEYDQGQHDGIQEVLSVSTAGALIRRDIFEELGGFDTNLELFRDDVDFGWRVHVAGHSVLAVTDAIGYHAQASATERRSVDVKGALLDRPLLLDRQNAAYVILANSSWWTLPWLSVQLLGGAILRSIGYLFAKLPGYASDELLAVASLIIKPGELLRARKDRKAHRFISSRVVKKFIPSRFQQLRSAATHTIEAIREKVLPESTDDSIVISDLEINEDEDLLTPSGTRPWKTVFMRPMVAAATLLFFISLAWTRNRIGSISGGALAESPESGWDLVKFYVASWHEVGMGSGLSTPPWLLFIALGSIVTLGNVSLFITLFFIAAPFILLVSAHRYLKRFTENAWLVAGASLLYAISPVSIAAVNSGRVGVIVFMALLPFFAMQMYSWNLIENRTWRSIFAISLFIWVLFAFNPSVILVVFVAVAYGIYKDLVKASQNYRDPLFINRTLRRVTILLAPFFLSAPGSFAFLIHPSRLLGEIGMYMPGGGPNLAFLANPGGPGSLPWWVISPLTFILFVAFFSTTAARRFAATGLAFLLAGTLLSAFAVSGHGSAASTRVFAGTFITASTLSSIAAAVVMFDKIRARLEQSHINYRHVSVALVLIITVFYTATSSFWMVTKGSQSPVSTSQEDVLPAFIAVEEDGRTLVIRPYTHEGETTLSYYLSHGNDVILGEPDVAPTDTQVISRAVEGLVDNTGVASSKIFSSFGIKYVFLKKPYSDAVVRSIDGLGGFNRTSATDAGIVWKVLQNTGRLRFEDYDSNLTILSAQGVRAYVDRPGTLTLTESYSRQWQIFADGVRLPKLKDPNGLPSFAVGTAGEISVIHDGTIRRAWISFFTIILVTLIVLSLPGGRRKSEISAEELA